MFSTTAQTQIQQVLAGIKSSGLWKDEAPLESPQSTDIRCHQKTMINFCANNYLGLANNNDIIESAKTGLDTFGYGLSSVRFICGTQTVHADLEKAISEFLSHEDAILYTSCFDANGGLFETLLGPEDAVISDELNHASIIDGVRLCKAKRLRYTNNSLEHLSECLEEAKESRIKLIVTDGVFSMDGTLANLPGICNLADKHQALVMVDDSHATGLLGPSGKGTPAYHNVENRVDIITSTFGKALGGASGGFTTSHKAIIQLLKQRSRPYLFSNSLAPAITCANLKALEIIQESEHLRKTLHENTRYFRRNLTESGFDIVPGDHPIVPIMIYDAKQAKSMASYLFELGIYVVAFSYPVVPKDKARIRVQLSAAHTQTQLDRAIDAFKQARKKTLT